MKNQRYDGSYYTTEPAAALLAGIAIGDDYCLHDACKNLKVVDPACGSGILLMAVARRLIEMFPRICVVNLVENTLEGYDINADALRLAMDNLAVLAPSANLSNVNLYLAKFGDIHAGSLEILDERRSLAFHERSSVVAHIDTGIGRRQEVKADLVIMNPPFTRNALRHDQLETVEEKRIKAREKEIFSKVPVKVPFFSSSPAFLVLAEYLCKQNGTVAMVQPLVSAMAPSGQPMREWLCQNFHVETMIVSCDPKRIYFSEDTSIAEMLIVLRRKGIGSSTQIVSLARNPENVQEALQLSRHIREKNIDGIPGEYQTCPYDRMKNGDWSCVQFHSPFLVDLFQRIRTGELFDAVALSNLAKVESTYRAARSAFKIADAAEDGCYNALWHFKAEATCTMRARTDSICKARHSANVAARVWSKRSRLLLPVKVQTNRAQVIAVRLDKPTLGSYWMTVEFYEHKTVQEKAMCAYLNSTLGLIAMLGERTPKNLCYPDFSLAGVKNVSVPVLSKQQQKSMAQMFDKYADQELGRWREYETCKRIDLDREIARLLDVEPGMVMEAGRVLASEPMCTNARIE